ncbi:MAG: type II toxin-antitoxin system HicA family toxin [Candidatus Margulisiibacteriota bacterium]
MSDKDKLLKRLMSKPKDFKYSELKRLLSHFGFIESTKGKTSGSRVAFVNSHKDIIRLHKPHPKPILKEYQIQEIVDYLSEKGMI